MENNSAGKGMAAVVSLVATFFIAKVAGASDLLAFAIAALVTIIVGWWVLRQ